jgi:hypothetical protein
MIVHVITRSGLMAVVNVFTIPLQSSTSPKKKSHRAPQEHEWCVITDDDIIRMIVVDMIIESCDAAFGPAAIFYEYKDREVILVSYEMVQELKTKYPDRFIALHKENHHRLWMMDRSTARVSYFGSRYHGRSVKSFR